MTTTKQLEPWLCPEHERDRQWDGPDAEPNRLAPGMSASLSATQAERYLGVKAGTVRQWARRGKLVRVNVTAQDAAAHRNRWFEQFGFAPAVPVSRDIPTYRAVEIARLARISLPADYSDWLAYSDECDSLRSTVDPEDWDLYRPTPWGFERWRTDRTSR